jgi:diguanylate cyclase (GGDEF)-like protein
LSSSPAKNPRRVIDLGSAVATAAIASVWLTAYSTTPASTNHRVAQALASVVGIGLVLLLRRLLLRLLLEQQAENLRFDTAINNISQGLCFFDGQQRLIVCNARYAELYRLTPEMVRPGTTLRQIVDQRFASGTCPNMTPEQYLDWRRAIAVSETPSDTVATLQDGRILAIHHQPMPDGGWVATHEDITERRRAVDQVERMARTDALTGLANRVQFRERLTELLQQSRPARRAAVLFIDLDRFKTVNDTLGHPMGDALLRASAQRLLRCVREGDMVARLGGDEFAIIQVGDAQPAAALSLSERLVRDFALPFEIGSHQVRVGTSVGVALSPDDGSDPDDLLRKADLALYDAKGAGRGRHSFFRPVMVEQAQDRHSLELDLRDAAARHQLELHYQPIMALGADRLLGFEALLRWRHPERGMVMPDQFIPLAEDTGLIEAIGNWVLNEAFAQASRWPAPLCIAVNLSPLQVKSSDLPGQVAAALRESGLDPQRVELEITESVRLAEDATNLARLHDLQALGVRICLDDFGVGYSSLSYLRSFPFKKIKIDRSFVRDVAVHPEAAAIVRAIAALGNSLGMVVTAEGVEHADQMEVLRELGCDEVQGYHLGRPQPAQGLASWWPRSESGLRLVTGGR